jgi:AcrR family transcriptional regulator
MHLAMADVNPARPSRRDRARATRLRMIHAAQRVFTGHGYAGARMTDIAAEAGVAVQTVYFTFHTKAELLQACYELAVLGEDDPRPPPAQPWYAAMLDARGGRAAIRRFAEGNSAIAARVAQLDDVVRSAAHEPDAARVRAHNELLRREVTAASSLTSPAGSGSPTASTQPTPSISCSPSPALRPTAPWSSTTAGPTTASSTGSRQPSASSFSPLPPSRALGNARSHRHHG